MRSETIDVPTADGVADAYLTMPDEGVHPGVLFVMDAIGLRARIEEMADRIAARGFVVLAPNTLYRAGRAPVFPLPDLKDADNRAAFIAQVRPLIGDLTADVVAADGDAYLDALSERAAPGPVAITGYCMGGRVGWHIARSHPGRVAALASFHGGNLAVADDPESPHRSAGAFDAELYFGHADQDHSMTAEQIELLEQALEETDLTYRSELYDGAAHGWTMSDTAVYDEAATERHFEELFALLDRTIAAPAG